MMTNLWIFCCGMKRSGSTLQFQLTAHLVEQTGQGERLGWAERFEEAVAQSEGIAGWKVYKTHNYSPAMGAMLTRGEAKGVYVYRDLRDVLVSSMHKREAPFERLWSRDVLAEMVENFQHWTSHPNVLVSRYETMMADLPAEVERIAAHLGLPLKAGEAAQIAQDYSVDKQIERIQTANDLLHLPGVKGGGIDKHSQLHKNHISDEQGQVGQWRRHLTPEQVGLIEAKYGDWLVAQGYTLSEPLTWPRRTKLALARLFNRA
jgi:hypothetical protein